MVVGIQKFGCVDTSSGNYNRKGVRNKDVSVISFYKIKYLLNAPYNQKTNEESKVHITFVGQKVLVLLDDRKDIYVEHVAFGVETYVKEGLGNKTKN